MLFALIVLMCISILSAAFLKSFYIRKEENINFARRDMFSTGNYNKVLCTVNDYFYKSNESIDILKERKFFINNEIEFFYDSSINKFCIKYRYRGINYTRILKVIEVENKFIFVPDEKKYMS